MKKLLILLLIVGCLFVIGCDGEDGERGVDGITGPGIEHAPDGFHYDTTSGGLIRDCEDGFHWVDRDGHTVGNGGHNGSVVHDRCEDEDGNTPPSP